MALESTSYLPFHHYMGTHSWRENNLHKYGVCLITPLVYILFDLSYASAGVNHCSCRLVWIIYISLPSGHWYFPIVSCRCICLLRHGQLDHAYKDCISLWKLANIQMDNDRILCRDIYHYRRFDHPVDDYSRTPRLAICFSSISVVWHSIFSLGHIYFLAPFRICAIAFRPNSYGEQTSVGFQS
jgi:hypothetical protein